MKLLVIQEHDLEDYHLIIIGVADSVENAEKLIKEYYGTDCNEVSIHPHNDDDSIEYSKVLEGTYYRVEVWLQWFELNKVFDYSFKTKKL